MFPEPPPGHPLFDAEAQAKFEQFKELASSLHQWIREHTTIMQVTTPSNTLLEITKITGSFSHVIQTQYHSMIKFYLSLNIFLSLLVSLSLLLCTKIFIILGGISFILTVYITN